MSQVIKPAICHPTISNTRNISENIPRDSAGIGFLNGVNFSMMTKRCFIIEAIKEESQYNLCINKLMRLLFCDADVVKMM
jgi:hypothetical protein